MSMQDLPADILMSYEAMARARGLSLESLLRELLIRAAPAPERLQMSPDEWDKAIDDCFGSFPDGGPLPDDAFRREDMYGREDKW